MEKNLGGEHNGYATAIGKFGPGSAAPDVRPGAASSAHETVEGLSREENVEILKNEVTALKKRVASGDMPTKSELDKMHEMEDLLRKQYGIDPDILD
jgi:hypothetical protein